MAFILLLLLLLPIVFQLPRWRERLLLILFIIIFRRQYINFWVFELFLYVHQHYSVELLFLLQLVILLKAVNLFLRCVHIVVLRTVRIFSLAYLLLLLWKFTHRILLFFLNWLTILIIKIKYILRFLPLSGPKARWLILLLLRISHNVGSYLIHTIIQIIYILFYANFLLFDYLLSHLFPSYHYPPAVRPELLILLFIFFLIVASAIAS